MLHDVNHRTTINIDLVIGSSLDTCLPMQISEGKLGPLPVSKSTLAPVMDQCRCTYRQRSEFKLVLERKPTECTSSWILHKGHLIMHNTAFHFTMYTPRIRNFQRLFFLQIPVTINFPIRKQWQ